MSPAHCLEYIRLGIMCKGDASLEYWAPAPDGRKHMIGDVQHTCVDWDQLVSWADEHELKDKGSWMGGGFTNHSLFVS